MSDRHGLDKRCAGVLTVGLMMAAGLIALGSAGGQHREPASRPGGRAPGLQFFRLTPESADTTFHLLVIPVRFPEDATLGGGDLDARLVGDTEGTLEAYYRAATFGRLRVLAQLAPTVTAGHARSYYTREGDGNLGHGLDSAAYPHNARRLVEEVTGALEESVDFRQFDNTGDGIVDGLLLLHSGPAAKEVPEGPTPKDVLLPHAFTLSAPLLRADAYVFPYAVASTRDSLGAWAHEVGHLFGLPDLYVSNLFGVSEGVGKWSLMATGAWLGNGGRPSGLDAFSRQLLGVSAERATDVLVDVTDGTFLRAFRAGDEEGPEYFLVERRAGVSGVTGEAPATVVYLVNETAVDNRNPLRPLVEVRGAVCRAADCDLVLDDGSSPSLRDRTGRPTGLGLEVTGGTVLARHEISPSVRLERVRLLDPEGASQTLELTVQNPGTTPIVATLALSTLSGSPLQPRLTGGETQWTLPLQGGENAIDARWALAAVLGDTVPATTVRVAFTWSVEGGGPVRMDSLECAAGGFGLNASRLGTFEARSLRGRDGLWSFDGTRWDTGPLGPFADTELVSPWFTVPPGGLLRLEHAWSLEALALDAAQDGGEIRVETQTAPAVVISPSPPGWGYTAERGTGNALGGLPVLAGAGARGHVLDFDTYSRQTVRLIFRAAAWSQTARESFWEISRAEVAGPASASFVLEPDSVDPVVIVLRPVGEVGAGTSVVVYGGVGPSTPLRELLRGEGPVTARISLDSLEPGPRVLEAIWLEPSGKAGTTLLRVAPSVPPRAALFPPFPNPLRTGETQRWRLDIPEGATGVHCLVLLDAAGRRVVERTARVEMAGTREFLWNGRDTSGRLVPAGVYFLQHRLPDGETRSCKVVVLP